jgi:DNA-directed RNA polymerase subunit K/omega
LPETRIIWKLVTGNWYLLKRLKGARANALRQEEKEKKDPDPQKKKDAPASASFEEKGLGLILHVSSLT